MTPDLRKLAAPLVAQVSSFVVVLVIGAFIAQSPSGGGGPVPSGSVPASSPAASSPPARPPSTPASLPASTPPPASTPSSPASSPPVTPGPEFSLYVQAFLKGKPLQGEHRVIVLLDGTRTIVRASHMINGTVTLLVPSGHYQVCLKVPAGMQGAGAASASILSGWICLPAQGQTGASVTFGLVPEVPA